MSSMGSTTPPPSIPECKSGKPLDICGLDEQWHGEAREHSTYLDGTMHHAPQPMCDTGWILRNPSGITTQFGCKSPPRAHDVAFQRT